VVLYLREDVAEQTVLLSSRILAVTLEDAWLREAAAKTEEALAELQPALFRRSHDGMGFTSIVLRNAPVLRLPGLLAQVRQGFHYWRIEMRGSYAEGITKASGCKQRKIAISREPGEAFGPSFSFLL
jgi:hypothetical protein